MGKQQNGIMEIIDNWPTVEKYINTTIKERNLIDGIVKNASKPNKVLRVGNKDVLPMFEDFWQMPWGKLIEVRELQKTNDLFQMLNYLWGITEKEFLSLDVFNAFASYKWVTDQLTEIANLEIQELSHDFTQKEKDAGIERLQRFGHYPSLNSLTGGDITKEDEILEIPYQRIFMKFCLNKTNHDIELNLNKA